MNYIDVKNSRLNIPEIGLGCMRISGMEKQALNQLISSSVELGINFYDHADIYGGGESEKVFAAAVKDCGLKREDLIIQSKAGIKDGLYDLSKDHLLKSLDGILKRLETDYLDAFLVHRPDALMEPEEVADAFTEMERSGKVRNFGVSNQNPGQIELLKKYVEQPLIFNQLQLSIMRTGMIDRGINVNMKVDNSLDHDGGVLDYCRLNDITVQSWSPFQYGFFEGVFLNNEKFPELNKILNKIAEKYSVTNSAVAVAWILRHPAKIQTIVGTTNPGRLKDMATASHFKLTREEWYKIYKSAGNVLP